MAEGFYRQIKTDRKEAWHFALVTFMLTMKQTKLKHHFDDKFLANKGIDF